MHSFIMLLAQVNADLLPKSNPTDILPNLLKIIFGITTMLSVIFVAYGGFRYTTSNGDPQGVTNAKNTILAAIIGLVISISSFVLVGFVVSKL